VIKINLDKNKLLDHKNKMTTLRNKSIMVRNEVIVGSAWRHHWIRPIKIAGSFYIGTTYILNKQKFPKTPCEIFWTGQKCPDFI